MRLIYKIYLVSMLVLAFGAYADEPGSPPPMGADFEKKLKKACGPEIKDVCSNQVGPELMKCLMQASDSDLSPQCLNFKSQLKKGPPPMGKDRKPPPPATVSEGDSEEMLVDEQEPEGATACNCSAPPRATRNAVNLSADQQQKLETLPAPQMASGQNSGMDSMGQWGNLFAAILMVLGNSQGGWGSGQDNWNVNQPWSSNYRFSGRRQATNFFQQQNPFSNQRSAPAIIYNGTNNNSSSSSSSSPAVVQIR